MFEEKNLLSIHSNYKIGGSAKYFFDFKTEDVLEAAVNTAQKFEAPIFGMGGGTNILFSDDGFNGAILKPTFRNVAVKGGFVRAGAGIPMAELLEAVIDKNLAGLEWAGGLPGTLGGAIRGNAGAFGGEIKDAVDYVISFDIADGKFKTRKNPECRFGYRNSIFKNEAGKDIIWEVGLRLNRGDGKAIRESAMQKIQYRKERHPMEYPNIGSIFKNIDAKIVSSEWREHFKAKIKNDPFPVIPAAAVIAETGLVGVSCGGAMISPKHPNFIVNVLNARASDVRQLIGLIKQAVLKKFDVQLEEEIMQV